MTPRLFFERYREVKNPIRHFFYKFAEIVFGTLFLSRPGRALWRVRLSVLPTVAEIPPAKIAVIAHVYHTVLLAEIVQCWRNCPPGTTLHITTPDANVEQLRSDPSLPSSVIIHATQNRGRDIGPFITVLGRGALAGYDAVLKIHTKRSSHLLTGDLRRRLLLANLAGDARQVRRIAGAFKDPTLGLAGFGGSLRRHPRHWGQNRLRAMSLLRRMEAASCTVPEGTEWPLAYFEGSMFWFRPAALAQLDALALSAQDFEPEVGQLDGMLQHALERLFIPTVALSGFETRLLGGRRIALREGVR